MAKRFKLIKSVVGPNGIDLTADFEWTGAHTWTGDDPLVIGADNKELRFGAGGDDLAIYHDGSNNYIDSNVGGLLLRGSPGNSYLEIESQSVGRVSLYGTGPSFRTYETDAAADEKGWSMGGDASAVWVFKTLTDAGANGSNIVTVTRSGTTALVYRILTPLRVDSLHTDGVLRSGTYTPTVTNVANLGTVTPELTHWLRVGDVVHVAGKVVVDPTTAGVLTRFRLSLPIASSLTDDREASGVGIEVGIAQSATTPIVWSIFGDAANDAVEFRNELVGFDTARDVRFTFTYRVI